MWAAKGRNATTLRGLFDLLGEQRCAQLTHVSADGAQWIHDVVAARAPAAVRCVDAFYGDLRVMPRSGPLGLVAGPSAVRRSA